MIIGRTQCYEFTSFHCDAHYIINIIIIMCRTKISVRPPSLSSYDFQNKIRHARADPFKRRCCYALYICVCV